MRDFIVNNIAAAILGGLDAGIAQVLCYIATGHLLSWEMFIVIYVISTRIFWGVPPRTGT